MMEKKGMAKKGDVTITTVILIVLGLAILVFLIMGVTQGFDIFFGSIEKLDPGDLQILATACVGYAEADADISYCTFKSVDTSEEEWINCEDSRLQETIENEITVTLPECNVDASKDFCLGSYISKGKWTETRINGKNCAQVTGNSTKEVAIRASDLSGEID